MAMIKPLQSLYQTKNKELIKVLRKNKKITPMKVIISTSNRQSILFQKPAKTVLVIPIAKRTEHIEIHLDKHFQLVKYMWRKRNFKDFRFERIKI